MYLKTLFFFVFSVFVFSSVYASSDLKFFEEGLKEGSFSKSSRPPVKRKEERLVYGEIMKMTMSNSFVADDPKEAALQFLRYRKESLGEAAQIKDISQLEELNRWYNNDSPLFREIIAVLEKAGLDQINYLLKYGCLKPQDPVISSSVRPKSSEPSSRKSFLNPKEPLDKSLLIPSLPLEDIRPAVFEEASNEVVQNLRLVPQSPALPGILLKLTASKSDEARSEDDLEDPNSWTDQDSGPGQTPPTSSGGSSGGIKNLGTPTSGFEEGIFLSSMAKSLHFFEESLKSVVSTALHFSQEILVSLAFLLSACLIYIYQSLENMVFQYSPWVWKTIFFWREKMQSSILEGMLGQKIAFGYLKR